MNARRRSAWASGSRVLAIVTNNRTTVGLFLVEAKCESPGDWSLQRPAAAPPHTMSAMLPVDAMPRGDGWECTVVVSDPGGVTSHTVDVAPRDLARWGRTEEPVAQLVRRAFEFLLARESS